jgi:hypothetical protein
MGFPPLELFRETMDPPRTSSRPTIGSIRGEEVMSFEIFRVFREAPALGLVAVVTSFTSIPGCWKGQRENNRLM